MSAQCLYWDNSYEIVMALQAAYPDAELESIGLNDLYQRIVNLPAFADDVGLVNDAILMSILREWYEEIGD